MEICSDKHEEVCYESKFRGTCCPVCSLREEKDNKISKLENEIASLKED